jgi:hypothetical protein
MGTRSTVPAGAPSLPPPGSDDAPRHGAGRAGILPPVAHAFPTSEHGVPEVSATGMGGAPVHVVRRQDTAPPTRIEGRLP